MEIDGAEAVVTGASGGLGGAIARALHARGARVILTARREESLQKLSTELNGADVVVCDLTDREQVLGLVTRLAHTDIVVFNAATPGAGRLDDFTPEQLDRALAVNLRVPMLMTQQLLPAMLQRRRGHFVYISSMAGKVPSVRQSVYSAAKFGLRGFCGALRGDLYGSGVSASAVFPEAINDAGMLADFGIPLPPGMKGVSSDTVARAVIDAIEKDRGEVDAARLSIRLAGKLGGLAPGLVDRMTRRPAHIAWIELGVERTRHIR